MNEQQTHHAAWGQQQGSPPSAGVANTPPAPVQQMPPYTSHPYGQPPYAQPHLSQPQKPAKNWTAFWFGILYMLIFVLSQFVSALVIVIVYVVFLVATGGDFATLFSDVDIGASGGILQNIMAATLIVSSFATVGILWWIAKVRGFNPKEAAFMNPTTPLILIASLIFGVAYSVSFNSFVNLPVFGDLPTIESQQILYGSLIMALTGSILVPIVEELVFRGFVLNELRRGVGIVAAFFISSFVFGLIHGHPLWALMAGIIGMVFALFALRTRSVYPAIMAHIGVNAASFVFIEISKGVDSFSSVYVDFLNTPTLLTLMAIAGILLIASFIIIIVKSESVSTIGPAPEPVRKTALPTYPYAVPLPMPATRYYPPASGAFPQQGQPFPSQGQVAQTPNYPPFIYPDPQVYPQSYPSQVPSCPPCPQDCPHLAHCMQYGCPQPPPQQQQQQQMYPNPQAQAQAQAPPLPQTQQDTGHAQENQEEAR